MEKFNQSMENLVSWWFINGLSQFFKYKEDKKERLKKGMIAKNVTFQNVTYDLEWFNTHNLTHNYDNPKAAEMQLKRR